MMTPFKHRGLPKTVAGLERAIRMNTQIAAASALKWRDYHLARVAACEEQLEMMKLGRVA